jgi:hypothetical protein
VRRPLLVQTHGSRATFFEATKVKSTPDFDLWRPHPHGVPRLSLLAEGWYMDGWIAWPGIVTIWPDATGWVRGLLRLRVDVPRGFPRTPVTLTAPGFSRTVVLRPNAAATIRVLVEHPGRWKLELSTPRAAMVGLRAVSVRGLEPSFQRSRGHAGPTATLAHTS